MEFVEKGNAESLGYILVIIGLMVGALAVVIVAIGIPVSGFKNRTKKILTTITIAISVVPFITGLIFMFAAKYEREDRDLVLANSFNETYGVDLKSYEITSYDSLNYPSSKPESDFQRYGTLTKSSLVDDKLVETSVTLVWADGEMRLYGLDENKEVGSELPRVDESQE